MGSTRHKAVKQRLLENVTSHAYGLERRFQQPGLARIIRAAYIRKDVALEDVFTTKPYELVFKFASRLSSLHPDTYLVAPRLASGGVDSWRGSFQEIIAEHGEALREVVEIRLGAAHVPNKVLLDLVTLDDVRAVLGDPDTLID